MVHGFGDSVLDGRKGMTERPHVCGSVVQLLTQWSGQEVEN